MLKSKKKQILFFCPLPPPLTGQSMASQILFKEFNSAFIINTSLDNKNKIFGTLKISINILYRLLFFKISIVYFTCTRSKLGAVKDMLLLFLCRMKNIKVVNHVHGNDLPNLFQGGMYAKSLKYLYCSIYTTIFLFEGQKEQLAFAENMNKIVVSNCYEPILDEFETEILKDNDNIHVLYLSNLMESKGIFVFMEAIENLLNQHNNLTFHIAGSPMNDYLSSEKEVEIKFNKVFKSLQMQYGNKVLYHGVVTGKKKKELFMQSDVFVLPTFHKTEAQPISIIEALRTGCAVVTTKHNFLSEMISPKEGVLVNSKNSKDLEKGIKQLIANRDNLWRMQEHNSQYAKESYSPQIFVEKIKAVINSC